jgi:hypothetical protein
MVSGGRLSQRGVVAGGRNSVSWLVRGDFARLGITTPCVGQTRVPSLYHFGVYSRPPGTNQFLERLQRLTARKRRRRQPNWANNRRIEHPLWDLQQTLV